MPRGLACSAKALFSWTHRTALGDAGNVTTITLQQGEEEAESLGQLSRPVSRESESNREDFPPLRVLTLLQIKNNLQKHGTSPPKNHEVQVKD